MSTVPMSNNNNVLTLSAPLSGPLLALGDVPDDVFASGAMGDGIAIDPLNDCLHAPCDGVIIHVARTGHALTIRAANGAELLMHLGIDTVELGGEGFELLVEHGAQVSNGQALVRFDLDRIARRCKSLVSPIILTNSERFELTPRSLKTVKVGEPLMQVAVRSAACVQTAVDNSTVEASARVRVTHRGGLHARPAALIRKTAQGFSSQAQLHFEGKSAACDSLIGLMGLGIGEGDEVRVSCRGNDAEAALQALVAALSVAISEAHQPPAVTAAPPRVRVEADVLQGVCAAPGLVCGPLIRLSGVELPADTGGHRVDEQLERLDAALEQVRGEIRDTLAHARQRKNAEEEDIFAAHQALLEDPALLDAATASIEHGSAATHAWRDAIQAQCAVLLALGKPLFAERANDLRDLQQRVLRALLGDAWHVELPAGAIVSAHELTPSDLLQLSAQNAVGICMAEGGATSHVAILARGQGLPCVVALGTELLDVPQGQRVVLDAANGRLELAPSDARHAQVHQIRDAQKLRRQQQQTQAQLPAHTTDGVSVEVAANVASSAEAEVAFENGADGVGLLRTEFLFVDRRTAPDEQEQRQAYQAVLDAMGDKSVIIRTIDVGGDKQLDYLPLPAEANPVLGLRGIRLAQVRPDVLDQQLRALLQVAPLERCRILLPMVSEVDELLQIRQRLDQLCAELELTRRPELGVMIEVPAAALMAEQLALYADFLSIGTNDLSQYTLAMDRDHAGLAARVDALHPALLRLIAQTCAGAAKHGRWVGVCGALACDPMATPVLIGLGVSELSVSPLQIGEIKDRVRHLDAAHCRQLSQGLLDLSSARAVRQACQHHWPLS